MDDDKDHKPQKGIPTWDGNPATWESYRRKAILYIEGTEHHQRYLCGTRLESNLDRAAEEACIGKLPGWLGDYWGGHRLIRFLGSNLA